MAFSFIAFLAFIVLCNLITPDRHFSINENRVLEPVPSFSWPRLFSGQYTLDVERYIADQFALRDAWIGMKSSVEMALGRRENNGVYLAADQTLIQVFSPPDSEELQSKVEAINLFAETYPDLNAYFMLVPNAVKILEEKLPHHAPVEDQSLYMRQVRTNLNDKIRFVDVFQELYTHRNEYLYYRTDHHWTTQAAYYAYVKLVREMGETPLSKDAFLVTPVTEAFYGTSQSKSGFQSVSSDTIELFIPKIGREMRVDYLDNERVADTPYSLAKLDGKDKYAVFLDGNHGLVKISCEGNTGKRLLIVKDSYANALIPFLTNHFAEIYVVDLRYYDDDLPGLIRSANVTDLLLLYNVDTFCSDSSIHALADYAVEAVAQYSTQDREDLVDENAFEVVFSNDLFIGDSISEGLSFYELLPEEVVAAQKGLDFISVRDSLATVRDRQPNNIYILLGINVIERSKEALVSEYASFIRELKQVAPRTTIYIQSILPVEPWVGAQNPTFDQNHIDECNTALKEMARDEGVHFVNIAEVATAGLHEGDGIHFKADFYPLWLSYLVQQTKTGLLQGGS